MDEPVYEIAALLRSTALTDRIGESIEINRGIDAIVTAARTAHAAGNKLLFLGLGAEAGSASHMAIDFSKNGGVRSLALTDPSAITCLSNDLGFENVFAKQVEFHGKPGDLLIILGSTGAAPALVKAAHSARACGISIVTITIAPSNNPLRKLGEFNLNIPIGPGSLATVAQLALCHVVVDFICGWQVS